MPAHALVAGPVRSVIDALDRFGEAIEYDLQSHLGMDLLEFFHSRYSWAKLFRLLNQLPWWSRYQLAVADDDAIAEQAIQHDDAAAVGQSRTPPLATWDPLREIQATLVDGFNAMISAQAGKKGQKPKSTPRPETGRDRAKRAQTQAETQDLFDLFTPGRR